MNDPCIKNQNHSNSKRPTGGRFLIFIIFTNLLTVQRISMSCRRLEYVNYLVKIDTERSRYSETKKRKLFSQSFEILGILPFDRKRTTSDPSILRGEKIVRFLTFSAKKSS